MAGRMQHLYAYFTQFEDLTVCCNGYRVACFSFWTVNNRSACFFTQVYMTTYKISMKMGLKNIFDMVFSFIQEGNVLIGIAKRIDYCCFPITFYIISRFTQAACI